MKQTVLGILAHVDAGKTTLSESLLYCSGKLRKQGRVDHGDTYLDYNQQEKNRGITIFSKQAIFEWNDCEFTLIDTPGHIDFSSEMERTLQVLDYAIVVISGLDGIQNHTETIWSLLKHYQIPTFVFVNKMDIEYVNQEKLMQEISTRLDSHCVDFSTRDDIFYETVAVNSEDLLNAYMEHHTIDDSLLAEAIWNREIFPCFFGSALKMQGIETFLDTLSQLCLEQEYPETFRARAFKISRDENGNRLTHVKITGGSLKAKEKIGEEKVDQIRRYSGNKFEMVDEVFAGTVCALKGIQNIQAGDCLGDEDESFQPFMQSYLNYRLVLSEHCDRNKMLGWMKQLAEEDPQLHIHVEPHTQDIFVQLMGVIQIEVLKQIIEERFGEVVDFDNGNVVYRETIADSVEGIGHFEPLRHYAEVHLLLEPGERGSGVQFSSVCMDDDLAKNWQRLILTHLEEKEHLGVLTGSPITDMKITLLTGKAHPKHTEGGDFRQATYRAVRQGLKQAQSILLEPYYTYRLELPSASLSRAIFDIEQMQGTFEIEDQGDQVILTGSAPVSRMQNYQAEVHSYTKGQGRMFCTLKGYEPCIHQDEIVEQIGYDSENDIENPTGSVFCSHGAGYHVSWNEVKAKAHVMSQLTKQKNRQQRVNQSTMMSEEQVMALLFPRNQGTKRKQRAIKHQAKRVNYSTQPVKVLPKCILVDGYNVIYDWPELKQLANENMGAAREQLIDWMCNYQGIKKCELILVFDAYQVEGNIGQMQKIDNIHVVYTKTAQSADAYIEKATHQKKSNFQVSVVTSDAMVQLISIGQGAVRCSSRELRLECLGISKKVQQTNQTQVQHRTYLLEKIKDYQES